MPNLEDYGITLTDLQNDPKATITELLDRYNHAVKTYRDTGDKASTGVKKIAEAIKANDETTVNLTDDVLTKLREVIYEAVTIDPKVSVLLFDRIQEVKDGIGSFRTEAMRGFDLPEDEESETFEGPDPAETFEEVEFLHTALGNFVNVATTLSGLSVHDLPADLVSVGKKSGKKEVSLPRKPNSPETKETDSAKGRHAKVYQMRYALNGAQVPAGVSLNRLALFYCSTPTDWINGSELMDLVEQETGKSWGADSWDVTVPAGTLSARKDAK